MLEIMFLTVIAFGLVYTMILGIASIYELLKSKPVSFSTNYHPVSILKPLKGKPQPITIHDLSKVKENDIVLMWSSINQNDTPYISSQAANFLSEKKIKMLGIQRISLGLEAQGILDCHKFLLGNDIPIIEGLDLDEVSPGEYFCVCLPLKLQGLDGAPARAIIINWDE